MRSLINFKNIASELKVHIKIAQDIHAQEAMHRAFRREIMADNLDIFQFSAKDIDFRNFYHGQIFCAAAHDYFDSLDWSNRIAANEDSCFNRDYCISCAGINAHMKDLISLRSLKFNRTSYYRIFMAYRYGYHIVRMLQRSLWAGCPQNMLDRYYVYAAAFFDKPHLYLYCAQGDGLSMAWLLIYPSHPPQLRAIHVETSCAIFEYLQSPFLSPHRDITRCGRESQAYFTALLRLEGTGNGVMTSAAVTYYTNIDATPGTTGVTLTVYDTGDTSSFVDSKIQTAGWASNTVGSASLTGTYADGDWMTLKFTMTGDSGKNAKLGEVTLKYNRE